MKKCRRLRNIIKLVLLLHGLVEWQQHVTRVLHLCCVTEPQHEAIRVLLPLLALECVVK